MNTTTRKTAIGEQKYKIVSHYIGDKNVDKTLEEFAIRRALIEYNYEGGYKSYTPSVESESQEIEQKLRICRTKTLMQRDMKEAV